MDNKKLINGLIRRSAIAVAVGLSGFFAVPAMSAATCEHVVDSQWGDGFVARVSITNTSEAPIEGWSVNWDYPNATIASFWSADVSSEGASVMATNLGWNKYIYPGETVSFGFIAEKTLDHDVTEIEVLGDICEGTLLPITPTPYPPTPYPPTPLPPTPPPVTPMPRPCADTWEFLEVSGLQDGSKITISWNQGWQGAFVGSVGNGKIESKYFGFCPQHGGQPYPERSLIVLESPGYVCSVEEERFFDYKIACFEDGSNPTPPPTPVCYDACITPSPTPTPTPTPPPVGITPTLAPILCGDIWETLEVKGLQDGDQILVSWNANWTGGRVGYWNNGRAEGVHFSQCLPIGEPRPPAEVLVVDSGDYSCTVTTLRAFDKLIECDK